MVKAPAGRRLERHSRRGGSGGPCSAGVDFVFPSGTDFASPEARNAIRVGAAGARQALGWNRGRRTPLKVGTRKESPVARSTRRLAAALLLTGAAALGVGACSPITTMNVYAPSDGVRGDLGTQIRVENLMILSPAEGAEGTVLGAVVNQATSPVDVTLTIDGVSGGIQLNVPAQETLLLSPDHEVVSLPTVPVRPGAVTSVQISTPESGSITLDVPVLDGTLPEYEEYVPAAPEE